MIRESAATRAHRRWPVWVYTLIGFVLIGWSSDSQLLGRQAAKVPAGVSGYTVGFSGMFSVSSNGYQLVRVTLETNPKKLATNDEDFTVVFKSRGYNSPYQYVTAPLTLESGKSSAYVDLYLPGGRNFRNQELFIEGGEGNREFNRGRDLFFLPVSNLNYRSSSIQPSVLLVSSAIATRVGRRWVCYDGKMFDDGVTQLAATKRLPAVAKLQEIFLPPVQRTNIAANNMTNVAAILTDEQLHACRPQDLPNRWLGLSGIQQILISMSDLKTICLNDDRRRDAIEKWVVAGGSLVVFDTGPLYKDADKILPLLIGKERLANLAMLEYQWREPSKVLLDQEKLVSTFAISRNRRSYDENVWVGLDEISLDRSNAWRATSKDGFVPGKLAERVSRRPIGFNLPPFFVDRHVSGRIVAVNDNLQSWRSQDWIQLQNALTLDGKNLSNRIGTANPENALENFKIPGVGDPPVGAFQILMSLFIFVAGPVMYFVLRRTRQLQLLFVLVPLMSLTACLGLIGYAVFVDGFDAWGRVQTVTRIDHQTHSAVTHARCGYYSGAQPAPYEFSADTVVMNPIYNYSRDELIRQTPSEMTISGGEIRARTPHQIVSVRAFQTDARLMLLPAGIPQPETPDGQEPTPIIGNRLGAKVLFAAVLTESGYLAVSDVADDEQKPGEPMDAANINSNLAKYVTDLSPLFQRNRWFYSVSDGMGDLWGDEREVIDGLRTGSGTTFLNQPGTYIAVLEEFPVTADQIESVQYKKQLHVILGKW